MDRQELEKWYGFLKGLRELSMSSSVVSVTVIDDYNNAVDKISEIVGEKLDNFKITDHSTFIHVYSQNEVLIRALQYKLFSFLGYLEYGYKLADKVIEIGSVYNSIIDSELKERCSDILSAPSKFDRVINQASQVLEDRIRTKAGADRSLIGANLVNKVLNVDPQKTVLLVADNPEVHEGVCHICRGIMIGFRNPTHHGLTDKITREEALKFTAFIDYILKLIEESTIIEKNK